MIMVKKEKGRRKGREGKKEEEEGEGDLSAKGKDWVDKSENEYSYKGGTAKRRPGEATPTEAGKEGGGKGKPAGGDRIFKVEDESQMDNDKFLYQLYMDVKDVRKLEYDGMNY